MSETEVSNGLLQFPSSRIQLYINFSVVRHCVTATWVSHGLHMFCHFRVLYQLDGDVSQTRAVADSSALFTFHHHTLVFQFASSAVVSWWGCHIVVAFGAFFRPTFAENDNLITMDIVNNKLLFEFLLKLPQYKWPRNANSWVDHLFVHHIIFSKLVRPHRELPSSIPYNVSA